MSKFPALCLLLIVLLSACSTSTIDPAAEAETAKARQAQQWLTGPAKWVVQRASQNNDVYYQRGVQQPGEVDMEVEWLRFLPSNRFDVQFINEAKPTELYYKIDGTTNELIVSKTPDFARPLDWRTKLDNIHATSVDLFIREGDDDLVTLTIIPQE